MKNKTRSPHHNYRSKSIYLITLNKAPGVPDFSILYGNESVFYKNAGVRYTPLGRIISASLHNIVDNFPEVKLLPYIMMPDHIHFMLFVTKATPYHLGTVVQDFTGNCTRSFNQSSVFEAGYHDRILLHRNQLERMRNYVFDNPRRRLVKAYNREFFTTPKILCFNGREYLIYGNFFLLRNPHLSSVKISRGDTHESLLAKKRDWAETLRSDGVLVSPFISPEEKEIEMKAIEAGANIILISRDQIGERFKPSGFHFDLCARGRLLIVSTFRSGQNSKLGRGEALEMNQLAEALSKAEPGAIVFRNFRFGR